MRRVELEQGSAEWLEWRRGKRMASETPAVTGDSPYQKPEQVRQAKRGGARVYQNKAMQRGHEEEEKARPVIAEYLEDIFQPGVFEEGDYGASVDGINLDLTEILEIKSPWHGQDSDRWREADHGEIGMADFLQVQHQLMVTGARVCHFAVWDGEDFRLVTVEPHHETWHHIQSAWDAFWPTVAEREDAAWHEAVSRYQVAKQASEAAAEELAAAKEQLIQMTPGRYASGGGVKVERVERKGTIDWSAIQRKEKLNVDVEQYRKPGSSYYQVKEVKADDAK